METTNITREYVKRELVNYHIACHLAAVDRNDGSISDEEYNEVVSWRLENILKVIDQFKANTKEQGAKK